MKTILLTLIFTSITFYAFGQGYPKGVYMSLDEVISQTPSQDLDLNVVERTEQEIKNQGGNDYKLTADIKIKRKNKFLRDDVLAYSDGDSLYFNCKSLEAHEWYSKLISDGRYMVFKAVAADNIKRLESKKSTASGLMMFGAIGGAIAGSASRPGKLALERSFYVIDKESGIITSIDPESLETLLSFNENMLKNFNDEEDKTDLDVQFKYLELLNKYQ